MTTVSLELFFFFHLPLLPEYRLQAALLLLKLISLPAVLLHVHKWLNFLNYLSFALPNTSLFDLLGNSAPAVYKSKISAKKNLIKRKIQYKESSVGRLTLILP